MICDQGAGARSCLPRRFGFSPLCCVLKAFYFGMFLHFLQRSTNSFFPVCNTLIKIGVMNLNSYQTPTSFIFYAYNLSTPHCIGDIIVSHSQKVVFAAGSIMTISRFFGKILNICLRVAYYIHRANALVFFVW